MVGLIQYRRQRVSLVRLMGNQSQMATQLLTFASEGWGRTMLITGAVAILIVLGLFLSMLSSSPKTEPEFHPDTEV